VNLLAIWHTISAFKAALYKCDNCGRYVHGSLKLIGDLKHDDTKALQHLIDFGPFPIVLEGRSFKISDTLRFKRHTRGLIQNCYFHFGGVSPDGRTAILVEFLPTLKSSPLNKRDNQYRDQ